MSEIKTASANDVDVQALMAEFDRESNTRHFDGLFKNIIKGILVAFTLYVFYMTLIATPEERVRRASFIGLIVLLTFMIYPIGKKFNTKINYIPWFDWFFGIVGCGAFMYFAIFCETIVNRGTRITQIDVVIGIIGIICLVEACRRVVGMPILFVAGAFVAYAFIRGFSIKSIVYNLFYTTNGIIGTPLNVCATFIVLFIIFGSFLEQTGIGAFFINIANALAGKSSGGPAKVAVISSALMGMYSGSSVANTVGSGSVTIPTMKEVGYKPEFAAAVEAAASTGGQIMPPIMGAAAFLMAEMTGTPYIKIAIAAILPAMLYFIGIFMMIHFEARKLGLKGLPKDQIPNLFKLLSKKGYQLLPIIVLVFFMSFGNTPARAAFYAIATAIVVSFFSKETRLTKKTLVLALENGTKNTIGVAVACAISGVIVGIVTLTGLGQDLINSLVGIASNSVLLALFLTMIACIVIGMGIPTTATYVIMATITAPIVIKLGVPVLAAHMFVFYFGIVADITPPVALAAYAGAAIAKADPLKTGITATRLAITAFVIPYIFALNPAMLLIDTDIIHVVQIIITSLIGIVGISIGMEGYMTAHMKWYDRIISIGGGLMMIDPNLLTDLAGLCLVAFVIVRQLVASKKQKLMTS